jgi:hypothetical protein
VAGYEAGFGAEDYERLTAAIKRVGRAGPFTADQALEYVLSTGAAHNAADVAALLDDLADLGYLRRIGGDPARWEVASG